jgi:hypothetical protein
MSTNLKLPRNAEPRSLQLGAAGNPARLAAAVENFKSTMLAVDRLIIDGATADAEIQNRVSEACAEVTGHLREHVEVNRPLEHRVGAFVFRAQRGRLRAASTFAPGDIAESDDVKVGVAVGQVMIDLGPHEVTANYPGVLAEWLVIDGDRVAPGQPLDQLHPLAGAR